MHFRLNVFKSFSASGTFISIGWKNAFVRCFSVVCVRTSQGTASNQTVPSRLRFRAASSRMGRIKFQLECDGGTKLTVAVQSSNYQKLQEEELCVSARCYLWLWSYCLG
jgi:hypothetical protein